MSMPHSSPTIAYFSMEIGLEATIPTYSGGLGVLAGDTLRSAADLGLPMVAVTLVHRKGYFQQHLDHAGNQTETPAAWEPERQLVEVGPRVAVSIAGREVRVRAWRYDVVGVRGHVVPVYLLDTDLPENDAFDRTLTDTLYGGDNYYRLCQEVVLGIGGARLLEALAQVGSARHPMQHHINEGHAALLTLALMERRLNGRGTWEVSEADVDAVRAQCVFTTHTPVPAGHDKFPHEMAEQVLGADRSALLEAMGGWTDGWLNMTMLALRCSHYANAVARRHQLVSQEMFPGHRIHAVTNGVHANTWTSEPFQRLFDRCVPGWREDAVLLRHAIDIPLDDIREAHQQAKYALLDEVRRRTGAELDPRAIVIGFARRATAYKRLDLIFSDPERLRSMARTVGPLQFVFAGKAHPQDEWGKALIRRVYEAAAGLEDAVKIVYLPNYGMTLGGILTAGSDLWLNNPIPPLEASGTSGMKAALNGVPSLSVLDGWWVEGCVEGATGWSIGDDAQLPHDPSRDITELYLKLERVVLPLYYGMPYAWATVMRNAISVNGSFFNTHRMVMQYARNAYTPSPAGREAALAAR